MHAISNLRGMRIVVHVHDEIIIEADSSVSLDEVCARMA